MWSGHFCYVRSLHISIVQWNKIRMDRKRTKFVCIWALIVGRFTSRQPTSRDDSRISWPKVATSTQPISSWYTQVRNFWGYRYDIFVKSCDLWRVFSRSIALHKNSCMMSRESSLFTTYWVYSMRINMVWKEVFSKGKGKLSGEK